MIRLEAWIDGQHALKAREEQDRAGEQHEREGHLRDNQAAAQQARAPPARAASPLFAQHGGNGRRTHRRGRDEPEHDTNHGAGGQGGGDDRQVEPDFAAARQLLNIQRAKQAQRTPTHRQPERRRHERQHQAFGDQLPRNPCARRSERQARRELLQPRARAHEDEVRDVHAANQQNEERAAPQQIQGRPHVADHIVLQPRDDRVEAGVDDDLLELRKSLEVGRVQPVDLGLRLLHGRTRFQPADLLEVVAVPSLVRLSGSA